MVSAVSISIPLRLKLGKRITGVRRRTFIILVLCSDLGLSTWRIGVRRSALMGSDAVFGSDTSCTNVFLPFRDATHHIPIPTLPNGIALSRLASTDGRSERRSSGSMTVVLGVLERIIVFRIFGDLFDGIVGAAPGTGIAVVVFVAVVDVIIGSRGSFSSDRSGAPERLLTPLGYVLVRFSFARFYSKDSRARKRAFTGTRV